MLLILQIFPLNVSRSSLQGDPNVRRISNYIIKKVAESLKKLYKKDRKKYEAIWEDIGIFVKYGCVSDTKFDEMMRDFVIFKNSDNTYSTLKEYQDNIPSEYKEKMKNQILYFIKDKSDYSLKRQLLEEKIMSLETDEHIDPHFMQHCEMKSDEKEKLQFKSIDSEIENILGQENTNEADIKIKDLFKDILVGKDEKDTKKDNEETSKEDSENNNDEKKEDNPVNEFSNSMDIEIACLKNSKSPAYFKIDEQMKRYRNMAKSMGQVNSVFPVKKTLVINPKNPLVQNTLKIWEKGSHQDLVKKICHHVEDLANISSEGLSDDQKDNFVNRRSGSHSRTFRFYHLIKLFYFIRLYSLNLNFHVSKNSN